MKYGNFFYILFVYVLVILLISCLINNSFAQTKTSKYPAKLSPVFQYANNNINIAAQYSDLFGYMANGKLTKAVNEQNAVAVELDYGKNENRIGITWGTILTQRQLFKMTIERLSESLPFKFQTGTMNQIIPQYGYGIGYQYVFPKKKLKNINIEIYLANAKSKTLDAITFVSQGSEFINYRHIAGAISRGVSIGFETLLWPSSSLQMNLNYDQVRYNSLFELIDTAKNNCGLGVTLNLSQLISKRIKLDLMGSKRELYDNYRIKLSWIPYLLLNQLETGFQYEHIVSHNSLPDENEYSLNFTLNLDSLFMKKRYHFSHKNNTDLIAWTNAPAIHMERVLAAADERIVKVNLLLSSLSPNIGTNETLVTLIGNGFTPDTTVNFGGTFATALFYVSNTVLNVIAPTHALGLVDVTVKNPNDSPVTLKNSFTYTAGNIPNPSTMTPNNGHINGGTFVTLSGSGFAGSSALASTSVNLGGISATNVTVVNDSTITCITPSHTTGTVDVVITNSAGSGILSQGFTYLATPAPASASPLVGPTSGGTSMTINGSGFTGTTGVTFGGTAATSVSVVNDTTITCVTPAHAAGSVDIVVTNSVGSGTITNGFTYLAAPAPTGANPLVGITSGGTSMTINGSGFTGTTGVTFGGTAATSVSVVNDTTITCVTPAHAAGSVNIVVTNSVGQGTISNGFSYIVTPAPSSANPLVGVTSGDTSVTISGSGFTGATGVTFGGTAATSVTVVNDTTITCVTPAHAAGSVNIVVTNSVGSGTITNGFTYYSTPTFISITPNTGVSVGLVPVTIVGSGFTGATSVTFGGNAATVVVVVSDTTITCVTPAHSIGFVNVVVSNPATSGTFTNGFRYIL